jgi:hypothetical protein
MTASDFVILRGGLSVPITPLLLLLDLEARGFRATRDGDDLVQPGRDLTADDRTAIRRWKLHLLALLDYDPPTA